MKVLRLLIWAVLLPWQGFLWLLLALLELLRPLFPGFWKRPPLSAPAPGSLCSIVVLNWNGRHLLEESLPALLRAVERSGQPHEVLVVDNGSEDDSLPWLRQHYPGVRVLALEKNLGFGEGNNRGVWEARHPIVVLLNNDMIVEEDFLQPLLTPFSDPSVFAVSSQVLFPPGKRREETGNTRGRWEWGYLHLSHDPLTRGHQVRGWLPVLWAGGGASAFDRQKFLSLGGFSPLFSPCYVEDTDLSYRAWRRGWKVLLAEGSRVLHKHRSSSSRRFHQDQLKNMMERRKLWYLWRNFQLRTLLPHFLFFPLHLTAEVSLRAYLGAVAFFPAVLWQRLREPRRRISDRCLWDWTHHPIRYLNHFQPRRNRTSRRPPDPLRILVVSAYLPHLGRHGGAGRVFQLLVQVARQHQVTLLTFVESEEEQQEVSQVLPHCARVETVLRRDFKPVSPFPYEPFEEFNSPDLRARLEQLLLEEDFDLVHFEWTQMAQYRDLIPDIPTFLTEIEVNYAAHYTLLKVQKRPWLHLKKYYDSLQTLYREVEMCRRVDRIICVTDKDRDYLKGYVEPQRLEIVNTGVDVTYFRDEGGAAVEPYSVVFVGAFRHQPNVDAMLFFCGEILPRIQREVPGVHLYIVGSGPPPAIRRLGEREGITVTGFVEDIRSYYRRAQVVVVPLRTGVGIRGKILEAWAAGKAIVATSLACFGIRAVHGENILIADEPELFARWVCALLHSPEFCLHLGRHGRRTAEQFYDWRELGEQLCRLYERETGYQGQRHSLPAEVLL